jgi:hypothetical protein
MRFRHWIMAGMLGVMAAAHAHGPQQRSDVVVTLDRLPVALRGIKAGLHQTVALQLLVENKSAKLLEVLDAAGKPFVRIAPDGSWGWFDRRLDTGHIQVPHRVVDAGRRAPIGRWKIPVRFGGVRTQLSGAFHYVPPPNGHFETRLTSPAEISPGVTVMLLRGSVPGFYVDNRSDRTITIYGAAGEPFLSIGPQGVQANVASPAWLASGKADVSFVEPIADAGAEPQWQLRSLAPRFSWLEPRAAKREWEVAIRHGDETKRIAGVTEWIPKK